VFYMGLHGIPDICKGLIGHGMPATTPVALVQQGTTQRQRVYIGTLDSLPELVQRESIKPPTLIIVGEVVRLHDKLNWFNPQS
jgi:uroporphyrin-III C-methyltransferase/precorrin-2 dehydrogenase/sirohydrochlorin ferrochelatase